MHRCKEIGNFQFTAHFNTTKEQTLLLSIYSIERFASYPTIGSAVIYSMMGKISAVRLIVLYGFILFTSLALSPLVMSIA